MGSAGDGDRIDKSSKYFDKLAALGFNTVCRRNRLGTTTMFAVHMTEDVGESLNDFLSGLPEWRLVDFVGDNAAGGAKNLYEKLTCTGPYATWDQRILGHEADHVARGGPVAVNSRDLLIGFEHRPESERFLPVED